MSEAKTMEFRAETKQLLDLMIHSIYTHREIFLRELISNASDAIDKVRFQSLTNPDILEGNSDFSIKIEINKDARTLKIIDNGIGMTYDEVIENIGTIAKSGSKAFIDKIKTDAANNNNNIELIGQFGVGFYSSFMVAKKVTLITKAPNQEKAVIWESFGDGNYTIDYTDKETRGTTIILELRDEKSEDAEHEHDFLNQWTIESLIKKHSDYIKYPIKMDIEEEKDGAKETITKTLNSMIPLWERNKDEVPKEEYDQFYKELFHDWEDPFEVINMKGEGTFEYKALLFIPKKLPYNFFSKDIKKGLKLYSKHVFIMDNCEDLLPEYLGFVKGLVDSPDLPLNISREFLQQNRQLKNIGKRLQKKVLATLETMQKDTREKYEEFWNEFGTAIKSGVTMDIEAKADLQKLLLFASSIDEKKLTTLKEYVDRMKEGQEKIYYATGKDRLALEKLPQMEMLKEKGYEVLYLYDRVDEFLMDSMTEFEGKKLQSIIKADFELNDTDKEKAEEAKRKLEGVQAENKNMLEIIKEKLIGKVDEVKITNKLKSSAVCLVSGEGISFNMEKMLSEMKEFQMFGGGMKAKKVLELNPEHKVFETLKKLYQEDSNSDKFAKYCNLLYSQAALMQGLELENPAEFANLISDLMVKAEE